MCLAELLGRHQHPQLRLPFPGGACRSEPSRQHAPRRPCHPDPPCSRRRRPQLRRCRLEEKPRQAQAAPAAAAAAEPQEPWPARLHRLRRLSHHLARRAMPPRLLHWHSALGHQPAGHHLPLHSLGHHAAGCQEGNHYIRIDCAYPSGTRCASRWRRASCFCRPTS